MRLNLAIAFNMDDGSFRIKSDIKESMRADVISEFIRSRLGSTETSERAIEGAEYAIKIELDLDGDVFTASDNCANIALRDGILLDVIRKLGTGAG